ncbi:peptidylprolyl isomerase [Salmonella enterica]|nr:peptidylprolyl isomerase [Salmonella enterica]
MSIDEELIKLQEQLLNVNKAILAVQNGAQEYRIGSRSVKRADLSLLYKERNRIEKEIEIHRRGGSMFHSSYFEGR